MVEETDQETPGKKSEIEGAKQKGCFLQLIWEDFGKLYQTGFLPGRSQHRQNWSRINLVDVIKLKIAQEIPVRFQEMRWIRNFCTAVETQAHILLVGFDVANLGRHLTTNTIANGFPAWIDPFNQVRVGPDNQDAQLDYQIQDVWLQ
jgi:hypothetical protein